jgi:hypothetical protein
MGNQRLIQGCMLLRVHIVQQDLFLPICHVHSPFDRHHCCFQHDGDYTAISRYLSTTNIRPMAVHVNLDQPRDRALNYNCVTDLAPYCNQFSLKITINIPTGCSANIVRFLHPSRVLSAQVTSLALSPVEATPQLFETLLKFWRLRCLRIRWGSLWPSEHRDWPTRPISMVCLIPSIRQLYVEMGPEDQDSMSNFCLPNVKLIQVRSKMPNLKSSATDVGMILQPLFRHIVTLRST